MAAIKELLERLAGGGSTSKRIRTDPMQYRCFMFTRGFVTPLRLPDKHPSELYIAVSIPWNKFAIPRVAILTRKKDAGRANRTNYARTRYRRRSERRVAARLSQHRPLGDSYEFLYRCSFHLGVERAARSVQRGGARALIGQRERNGVSS